MKRRCEESKKRRSGEAKKRPNPLVGEFLANLDPARTVAMLKAILNTLPDLAFVIKDRAGRFIVINDRNVTMTGVNTEDELIGKTSAMFQPKTVADEYERVARHVMRTGKPSMNFLTPSPDKSATHTLASIAPLHDRAGRICGSMAISRVLTSSMPSYDYFRNFQMVADWLNAHYMEPFDMNKLLTIAGCSHSKFYRVFRQIFKMPVREYVMWLRINQARDLLERSDMLISEIAQRVGFTDQSHFTRVFKRLRGVLPLQHRIDHSAIRRPESGGPSAAEK